MKVIEQSVEILTPLNGEEILKHIETCGRTCYKSEGSDTSAGKFVANIIKSGHESVLEHFSFTVRFVTDRAVTHEIVRHRLASYSQESQRYCNYSKDKFGNEITFIKQDGLEGKNLQMFNVSCATAEQTYLRLIKDGVTPEIARSVLPNCTKTEIVMTANLREWRHFLKLRTDKAAHPQIRALATDLLNQLKAEIPIVFDDILADSILVEAGGMS